MGSRATGIKFALIWGPGMFKAMTLEARSQHQALAVQLYEGKQAMLSGAYQSSSMMVEFQTNNNNNKR